MWGNALVINTFDLVWSQNNLFITVYKGGGGILRFPLWSPVSSRMSVRAKGRRTDGAMGDDCRLSVISMGIVTFSCVCDHSNKGPFSSCQHLPQCCRVEWWLLVNMHVSSCTESCKEEGETSHFYCCLKGLWKGPLRVSDSIIKTSLLNPIWIPEYLPWKI